VAGGVVATLAVAAALVVPGMREDAASERRAAAAAQAKEHAALNARIAREQRPIYADSPERRPGEDTLEWRARVVTAGQATVAADARRRVAAGTMDGPVGGVQCTPYPGTEDRRALEADPRISRLRYECFVYERKVALPELEGKARTGLLGVPYWLVADYDADQMVFCKVVPRAGEAGFTVGIPVPEPCRDLQA
jgi:hypothetical protein